MNTLIKNNNIKKAVTVCDMAFKIEFLIFGFLSFNSYSYGRPIMSVFVILSTALAGIDLLLRLLVYKNYIKNIFLWILGFFLVSYAVTTFINRDLGIMTPVKTFAWMAMQYVLLFACDNTKSHDDHKKEFTIFSYVFSVWVFASSLIGIIQAFMFYGTSTRVNFPDYHEYVNSGLVWGRLWGVYNDPNFGAVMAVVAVLLSLYYFISNKKTAIRILSALNILVQLLYIAFSDSRTGLVCLAISVSAFTFLTLIKKQVKKDKKIASVRIMALLLTVVAAFSCIAVPTVMTKTFNTVIKNININNPNINPADQGETIGREQDIENDFSNRRFDLWKSSIDVFKTAPVFGVSYNNLKQYSQQNCPDTYLVNNDYGMYSNFHNSYLNILAGQGAVGFLISIIFTVFAAVYVLFKYFKGKQNIFAAMLISVIAAIGASTIFLSDVFYVNSANATMFWYALGLSVLLLKQGDKKCIN